MKIVVLDGYTLNPGDLDWSSLFSLTSNPSDCIVYDRTPSELILERAKEATIILTNKTPLTKDTIDQLKNCKYIGVLATGYNVVDLETAREKSIIVTNIPSYSTNSVAQLTFALLLESITHTTAHHHSVLAGEWSRCKDFSYTLNPLWELANKTFGIVGLGAIGKAVGKIASAFKMNVIFTSRRNYSQEDLSQLDFEAKQVPLNILLSKSDFISLHCPLTQATHKIINSESLKLIRPTTGLINTSRGPLIDQEAVSKALNENQLAFYATDVLEVEPPPTSNPLFNAKNSLITPHIAWQTKEARNRLLNIAVENVKAFLNGKCINKVN